MAASTIAAVNQQQQHQQYYPSAGYQQTAAATTTTTDQHYNHSHQQQASNYYSSQPPASAMAANYAAAAAVAYNQQQSMAPIGHHQHHHNQSASTPNGRSSPSTVSSLQYSLDQATKSTKGASKLRRDLINAEIVQLRELLPLPASTRQRLSQLQLMALVLVYVRKSNYFNKAFENFGIPLEPSLMSVSTSGFSKALNGFIMMLTQKGKLLYISDNAAEYLGHSMEDLLSHGDEVYDIIEEQDKKIIRTELLSNSDDARSSPSSKSSVSSLVSQQQTSPPTGETRIALCRMNVSRNARRQMRFGDQKVVLIEGHYSGYLPLTSGPEPVFLANCTPVAMPETRECVVQGSTHVFTSIHSMDMKFLYIDGIGEHHLNCSKQQIHGLSWYELVHPEYLDEAQTKHKRITVDEQERSTIALLRMMTADHSRHIWVHSVMQVKEPAREIAAAAAAKDEDGASQPVIVCTNQVLSEREAQVMRANAWLYQFYSLHAKMHCPASYAALGSPGRNADTPDSVCSGQSDSDDLGRCSVQTTGDLGDMKSAALKTLDLTPIKEEAAVVAAVKKKRPAASSAPTANSSPPSKRTRTQKAQVVGSPISGSLERPQQVGGFQQQQPVKQASAKQAGRYSPRSTGSTVSSSPPVSAYAAASAKAVAAYGHHGGALMVDPFSAVHGQQVAAAAASHPYHSYANSLGGSNGSSSASSTSSLSSASSSGGQQVAATGGASDLSPMAVAAMSAAAGYAAIGASDPIHAAHMHTSHHHHHHPAMYSAAAAASYTNHSTVDAHHHQAAAANYASHVALAAQRSAASQHHHTYNPYDHQSTTQDQAQAYHNHHHHHHQPTQSHMAPYAHHHHHHHQSHHGHHNPHDAAVAAAAFYAPASYAHHQHHHSTAAAYHNHSHGQTGGTTAVAAAAAASAAVAAAAAAAHAQQGASFHAYNKLAATVNASA